MYHISPPQTPAELLHRANQIAGYDLQTLAEQYKQSIPDDLSRAKGWTGQFVEQLLGANAASQAEPDFIQLGIELKTIPVDKDGRPRETTYVCTVPLAAAIEPDWAHAWVRRKLARVLWLPIESGREIPLAKRRIGNAILWQPTPAQDAVLRQDWEEHMELISLGRIDEITAQHGTYLQIRPKAADSCALCETTDTEGNRVLTLPRGFYLRTSFTTQILAQNYL